MAKIDRRIFAITLYSHFEDQRPNGCDPKNETKNGDGAGHRGWKAKPTVIIAT